MGQYEGMCVCVCVGGVGIVWFGAKYFEMLPFCHWIISDPNQSPSDIPSDVLLKIILSPGGEGAYSVTCWLIRGGLN